MGQSINNGRLSWLDWMKAWAILAIIWGHFFSEGHVYLYVFSVQVFCVISGFLYKKSDSWIACVKKCFWQLFVPTVIMSLIMHMEAYLRCLALGEDYNVSWLWFFEWLLLGHRWCMGPCWYFYTLIVMRLIMQAIPAKKWLYGLLFIGLSAGAVYMNYIKVEISNANVNVLLCMPFFLIGYFMRPLKSLLCNINNYFVEGGLLIISVVLVVVCGNYNGYVWMYLGSYGDYFTLYILGGIAGVAMLYVISLWLSRLHYYAMIETLSKGSILIIGLHIIVVRRLTELPNRMCVEDLLLSVLIILAFIPVIKVVDKYFPILLGNYRKK